MAAIFVIRPLFLQGPFVYRSYSGNGGVKEAGQDNDDDQGNNVLFLHADFFPAGPLLRHGLFFVAYPLRYPAPFAYTPATAKH